MKCWGDNESGQLGDGQLCGMVCESPTAVASLGDVDQVRSGALAKHTCVITAAGAMMCWGSNEFGQLGNGFAGDGNSTNGEFLSETPAAVDGLAGEPIAFALGGRHTCALISGGRVACWGANDAGQLGDGTNAGRAVPAPVCEQYNEGAGVCEQPLSDVVALASADDHTCAVTSSGNAKCWGLDFWGQLGLGYKTPWPTPWNLVATDVCADYNEDTASCDSLLDSVVSVTTGHEFTCALLKTAEAKCWGRSSQSRLSASCPSVLNSCLEPVAVLGLSGAIQLESGLDHTCAILELGTAACWGGGYYGQLGDGKRFSTAPIPVKVEQLIKRQPNVRITRLRCHGDPEIVTIQNLGNGPQDLNGWVLDTILGATSAFDLSVAGVLEPAEYMEIYSNAAAPPTDAASGRFRWTLEEAFPNDDSVAAAQLTDTGSAVMDEELCGTAPPALAGDASCDGLVDAIDAALILQAGAALLFSLPCSENADVDGSGDVDAIDAALVLQFVAGLLATI